MVNLHLGVGKDALSYCTKCKLSLSHVIVSIADARTAGKVQCNTCKTTHAYRDPSRQVKSKSKKLHGSSDRSSKSKMHTVWDEVMSRPNITIKPYTFKDKFKIGDIIDHPKFGQGVIEQLIDNDKICVIFKHDVKTLIHNQNAK